MRAEPTVLRSQRVFRALLEALSRPGRLVELPEDGDGLDGLALTLLDGEVSFHAPGAGGGFGERVARATGARLVPLPTADFAFFWSGGAEGLKDMKRGTLEAPEEGATAVVLVERLSPEGGEVVLELSGPGVPGMRTLGVDGFTRGAAEAMRESRVGYPLGVEVYLIDGAGRVAGLPRSTGVEVVG